MSVPELLAFTPALAVLAISVFVAWRISKTGDSPSTPTVASIVQSVKSNTPDETAVPIRPSAEISVVTGDELETLTRTFKQQISSDKGKKTSISQQVFPLSDFVVKTSTGNQLVLWHDFEVDGEAKERLPN